MIYDSKNTKRIYQIVKEIDKETNGNLIIEKYQDTLQNLMTSEQIKNDLYLFLTLLRIEQSSQ